MQGSIERVTAVINGEMPDRAPMFDLLRNDAVINHFTGQTLTVENAETVVPAAYEPAIDATRSMRLPGKEETTTLEDGRERRTYRWTAWTANRQYRDSGHYEEVKRAFLDAWEPPTWDADKQARLDENLREQRTAAAARGDFLFMHGCGSPGLCGTFAEVGLEQFSYYLADCPDVIIELLERNTVARMFRLEHLPEDHGHMCFFLGDDIACNTGTLFSPIWLRKHYFPRLTRIIDVCHQKGIKILFHSDGDLNPILDDLVEAGVDGLNPIEVLANMDVAEIHRRYPHLFMAGGIDVSQLLPFGKPREIRDTVKRALDAAEGRIMIGSTTELNNEVPLENFLAMRDAVLNNPY